MTHDLTSLAAVVAYLSTIAVIARVASDEGLFAYWGALLRRVSGHPDRQLAVAAGLAVVVSAALTLDATAVLLTPVFLASGLGRRGALLSIRLANSSSILLPIANLTNLLAFSASGLGWFEFVWLMAPVWAFVVIAEVLIVRRATQIASTPQLDEPDSVGHLPWTPALGIAALLLAIAGGVEPWVAGLIGAVVLGIRAMATGRSRGSDLLHAANLPMAVIVIVWSWLVLQLQLPALLPTSTAWWALVATALIAMVAANLVNNLPATLLLLPLAVPAGPLVVLAVLIGVNVGANLSAVGSLANILWWRSGGSDAVRWREFHLLGIATTPVLVAACASLLWAWSALVR